MMVPTNLRYIDTNPSGMTSAHNFDPNVGDYGDKLYTLVPIGREERKEVGFDFNPRFALDEPRERRRSRRRDAFLNDDYYFGD